MVEIFYDIEKSRVFDLRYTLYEYISDSFFKTYPAYTELHFIQQLFVDDPNIHFIEERLMIWSIHFNYKYNDKAFTVVLDEDYDLISYAVENPEDRKEVAEHMCNLIENKRIDLSPNP